MLVFHLVDDIAERYLDMIDAFNGEIDELEDNVEEWPAARIRGRFTGLSPRPPTHPPDGRPHPRRRPKGGRRSRPRRYGGLFDRKTSLHFADAYDKLLRSSEGLELSRDLIAGARDYHQAKVANDQNEVTKKLTVIASVLLLPTFIVGRSANSRSIPELRLARDTPSRGC